MKELLELSALILSLVNGLMLLRGYLRDRPVLKIYAVHPDVYQWWFRLPDGDVEGATSRRYGFLLYVSIDNHGLRRVAVTSWELRIKTRCKRQKAVLRAFNTPEPAIRLQGIGTKYLPVLGQAGPLFSGDQLVDSGSGITGTAFYAVEFYGNDCWNPVIEAGSITGELLITDAFGGKAKQSIVFSKRNLEEIQEIIPDIKAIGINAARYSRWGG